METRRPRGPKQDPESVATRFWAKVDKTDSCWLWTGAKAGTGYGSFRFHNRTRPAHIVSWEYAYGPVPAGLDLDHLCRERSCVCPDHLEPVTRLVNVRRGRGHGSETHCPKGHEYSPENTRQYSYGRQCKACGRIGHMPAPPPTSQFRGVSWETARRVWVASIRVNGKTRQLGRFSTQEAAARAYDATSWDAWQDMRRLNFPGEYACSVPA